MNRIAIYEDNPKLRELLELLINSAEEFLVVGTHHNCEDILRHIQSESPDMLIMDIDMPIIDGITGVKIVKEKYPNMKVIMHTVFEDDDRLFACLSYGADGYILKKDSPSMLFGAIKQLFDGGAPMSPGIAKRILQTFRKPAPTQNSYHLTEREKEVLEYLTRGFSYKMIAHECTISIETVRRHLKNIYFKLQVQCGTEAVAKAIREKIVNE
ncbi:response regulator [Flectobacillus rivi]|uniref:Response regulator transcription factor n=1 Tax=Flectobacillus rivi TaxID=2984209 RepID=A0ABT6Z166_9BACT|nr:response regulator transcription factor [Flectobacillus rivi]MDI9874829.1 response regulator transcription factor [Flectobacillus rivi]